MLWCSVEYLQKRFMIGVLWRGLILFPWQTSCMHRSSPSGSQLWTCLFGRPSKPGAFSEVYLTASINIARNSSAENPVWNKFLEGRLGHLTHLKGWIKRWPSSSFWNTLWTRCCNSWRSKERKNFFSFQPPPRLPGRVFSNEMRDFVDICLR